MNINGALQAVNHAQEQMGQVSHRIALGLYRAKLPGDMVKMMTAEKEVKVAVSIIRTTDEMLGSLLDIKA
jgi:hypothetical protein